MQNWKTTLVIGGLILYPFASQAMYRPPFPGPNRGSGAVGGGSQAYRLFRASANHTCWSKETIGYSCYVSGVGYNDCMQARFSLGNMGGCCKNYTYMGKQVTNGSSVGMTGFSCTNW